MHIYARHNLAAPDQTSGEELLLEGSWPRNEERPDRWSLDEAIDARYAWIDSLAMDLAERAGPSTSGVSFAYINALALRYYVVKLLRVIAFFDRVRPIATGSHLALHVASGDEDYVELFEQLAVAHGLQLALHRHEPADVREAAPRHASRWRYWAARTRLTRRPPMLDENAAGPSVMLCGNPRVLNPVCAELLSRGARVCWLYERFAVRAWWRWRAAGVEQLVCETGRRSRSSFNDVSTAQHLVVEGIDLTPLVDHWLARRAAEAGGCQSLLVERVESHFRRIRPAALVVDEDATPLKRIAVAVGRSHRAASLVVQHGAPCGPFGFLPLAADEIAVWGDAARRQLEVWGLSPERIHVAGWPNVRPSAPRRTVTPSPRLKRRFLLLATMPPRDERPDNVEFHLTSANYRQMLEMVYQVVSRIDGATLTIKPHPRAASADAFLARLPEHAPKARRGLPVRIVRTKELSKLIAASDCVLSCTSTAGIEAALAGAPVIQLLPRGSGNILPADAWGFVGSARTAEELAPLVDTALERGWRSDPQAAVGIVAAYGRVAADRIVERVQRLEGISVQEASRE